MRILSWNSRGSAYKVFDSHCRLLARSVNLLLESKASAGRLDKIHRFFGSDWCIEVIPSSGGALAQGQIGSAKTNRQVLFCIVKEKSSPQQPWILTAVYASNNGKFFVRCWNWALHAAGDLNIILGSHEKSGGASFKLDWQVNDFANFINSNAPWNSTFFHVE